MLWMGLKKKAAYPGGAWSSGFRRLEGLVRVRFGRYRLLEQAVEQQPAVARVAAVETEGELVEAEQIYRPELLAPAVEYATA
jgi:hypothetical protein